MVQGIGTLQRTERVSRGSIRKAIDGADGDGERIQHAQAVGQVADRFGQTCLGTGRKIPEQPAQSMTPSLLTLRQMQAHSRWPFAAL